MWGRQLAGKPWLCGAECTLADCAAIPALNFAQSAAPFVDYLNLDAYWRRARQRPSYRKVLAEFEPTWRSMSVQQLRA